LPFSTPPYITASKHNIINAYVIDAIGLASDTVLGVVLDDEVALEQIHPTYSLALLPLNDAITVCYEEALFYADCFAYEHEIPTIAYPRRGLPGINFLLDKRGKQTTRQIYFHELSAALESVTALRLGPVGYVQFRYDTSSYPSPDGEPVVHLNYRAKYAHMRQEMHLYSLALRQIDPLSEYLCYYRVIESASKSNGLKWLEQNLPRLESTRFGVLPAGEGDRVYQRRPNLFTILRRRAVNRLWDLIKTLSYADIASKLYHTNRCGIAHGITIRRADFATDFEDVYLDSFVLKLMARIAIEDNR